MLSGASDNVHDKFLVNQCEYLFMALKRWNRSAGTSSRNGRTSWSSDLSEGREDVDKWDKISSKLFTFGSDGKVALRFRGVGLSKGMPICIPLSLRGGASESTSTH